VGVRLWPTPAGGAPEGGAWAGAHVEVVGRTWYLFNRAAQPPGCAGHSADLKKMGTQVRASSDGGRTWSPPTPILAPTPGSAWECAATDGDAAYDGRTGTWRYVFQCLGTGPDWAGCYAERHDPSPLGPFAAPATVRNPVIASGSLWRRICDAAADRCHRPAGERQVGEEGTFDIFEFDGDAWWVAFHGFDGTRGYRGIGRTETFRPGDWEVGGEGGTPTDAVLAPSDATGWRETWNAGGPVGAGAGSILEEDGWYYQFAEFPDLNLNCSPGQNWDLGLFRARSLSTGHWAQLPDGNPLVYSSRAPGPDGKPAECNVGYPRLFEDPATGVTYLMYGRRSSDPAYDGIYVYRVAWNRNLLANGDLRRADSLGWQALPGTSAQLSVERAPDGSPDGTAYLAFTCGSASCDGGQSIYQDVQAGRVRGGDTIAFGGTFRADAASGRLDMSVLQLDASGNVLSTANVPLQLTASYARARGELKLDARASRLRFELYPRSPGTFRADNLYLTPQDGCSAPRYPTC
jgi:hypothetical protein